MATEHTGLAGVTHGEYKETNDVGHRPGDHALTFPLSSISNNASIMARVTPTKKKNWNRI